MEANDTIVSGQKTAVSARRGARPSARLGAYWAARRM